MTTFISDFYFGHPPPITQMFSEAKLASLKSGYTIPGIFIEDKSLERLCNPF